MNNRILLVDDSPEVLDGLRLLFEDAFEVHTAPDGAAALELCRLKGPFAVVVSDHEMPRRTGIELFAELRHGWPDTTRILMTGAANLDLALSALHEGAVFRLLPKPVRTPDLCDAVEVGLRRYHEVEEERLVTEQLQFSRESLLNLTETLERRLARQMGRLNAIEEFVEKLSGADGIGVVASLTAETVGRVLGGRSTRVDLATGHGEHVTVEWGEGLSEITHNEPVCAAGSEIGSITLDRQGHDGSRLGNADQRVLQSIAASAAVAAHNQIRRRERDDAQHATIYALAGLAEHRDNETGLHLERVSEYCRLIAEGLREDGLFTDVITDGFVEDLVLSAPLHDIGKVGIPDSILLKPGKLTDEEWVVMRQHTTIGAETLRHILETSGEQSFVRMGHEIAYCHHERWDGTGYPRALEGEAIPLSARILALADCYDALTTRRPYKEPWSHDEAMACVLGDAGTHFDPRVVEAFRRRSDEADTIRRRLADDDVSIAKPKPHAGAA